MSTDNGGGLRGVMADLDFPPLTEEQKRSAQLYVCSQARDKDDAAELLAALGLI